MRAAAACGTAPRTSRAGCSCDWLNHACASWSGRTCFHRWPSGAGGGGVFGGPKGEPCWVQLDMRAPGDAGTSATVYKGGRRQRLQVTDLHQRCHLIRCFAMVDDSRHLRRRVQGRPPAPQGDTCVAATSTRLTIWSGSIHKRHGQRRASLPIRNTVACTRAAAASASK